LGWLHEVKHDGYRIIARKDGSRVTLWSRYGTNFTDRLPKIAEAVCSLAAESALIDGEAVAVRADGHSDFAALRTKVGSARACFVAFDLLTLNGEISVSVRLRNGEPHCRRSSPASTASCSATLWWPMGRSCSPKPAILALRGSSRSEPAADIRAETAGRV
jgi:hypothetical protein